MIASKCPKLHRSHLLRGCTRLYHFRRLDDFNKRRHNKDNVSQVSPRRPSLLEELFPEDFPSKETDSFGKVQDVPRLPLPEVDEFVEKLHNDFSRGRERRKQTADTAAAEAFKRNHLTVVSLQTASKSLVESDFRRIAPKGKHIGEWTGPGDILKGMQLN